MEICEPNAKRHTCYSLQRGRARERQGHRRLGRAREGELRNVRYKPEDLGLYQPEVFRNEIQISSESAKKHPDEGVGSILILKN